MSDCRSRPVHRPRGSRSVLPPLAVLLAAPLVWSACTDAPQGPITSPELGALAVPGQDAAYQAAVAAQNRHNPSLLAREDVVGSGIGMDATGGYVIRFYVNAPGLDVAPGMANLPLDLDGIPVELVATGLIMAGNVNDPTTKERPAPSGFSIGHPNITAGTMGAVVKNGAGDRFILSNNHVLAAGNDATVGDPSYQPGPYDGGTSADQIGTLSAFVPIDFSGGNNTVDAAITAVAGADVTAATPDYAYGTPGPTTVAASVGLDVQKFGRTTGHTMGEVAETNVTVDVCYQTRGPFICVKVARFVGQIGISDGSFSAGGDSGSLIVTNDGNKNPVGLLFAGSTTRTIANPIDAALGAFGVTITTDPGDGGDPPDNPPTASFTFSCTDLSCDFDGSGSSAGVAPISSYDWNFGDGNTDSGVTTSHTYAAGGTYTVTLTVDDGSLSDSDTQDVTVNQPGSGFTLSAQGYKVRGLQKVDLTWSGASGTNVEVWRDGNLLVTPANHGFYTDNIDQRGGGSYTYQICETGGGTCSNDATVTF